LMNFKLVSYFLILGAVFNQSFWSMCSKTAEIIPSSTVNHTNQKILSRKWSSTKNRSPRSSAPRHPVAMASTANPPDPMPCALAAVLLPETRARLPYAETPVSGDLLGALEDLCARTVPACGVRKCGVGARRESGQRHGCGKAVPGVAGGRRPLVGSPCSGAGT